MNKEEYELKKQEKLQEKELYRKTAQRSNNGKKFVRWLIGIGILVLIVWGMFLIVQKNSPQNEDLSVAFPSNGRDHIDIGTGPDLPEDTYNSNPPSSGPHYPNTAIVDFYDEPLEDQFVIHNLEHGDIWIAYHPRISEDSKERLKDFSDRYVIISPREANEFDISLVAWGRVDSFNLSENIDLEQRIKDFVLRYDDKGPEKVRAGSGHQASPI
jgi:hypothetical protein